jgi:hypothetical protein
MNDKEKILLGAGVLGLGIVIFMKRKALSEVATSALDAVNDTIFQIVIPGEARPYADVIKQVANEKGVDPFLIVALGQRESGWGTVRGSGGTRGPTTIGLDGTGHGLMQIDSGTWGAWLEEYDWTDPYTNVSKGVDIYNDDLAQAQAKGLTGDAAVWAALGAYNHGPRAIGNVVAAVRDGTDPLTAADINTTDNYASGVWNLWQGFAGSFASSLGLGGGGEEPV